jgi:hypothetical protein
MLAVPVSPYLHLIGGLGPMAAALIVTGVVAGRSGLRELAVADGVLPQRRLTSWRKLQREVAYQQRRGDARLESEERAKWRARSKHRRQMNRP